MKTFNVYDAKTNFSKLLDLVEKGEEIVIARNGKPVANLSQHRTKKNKIKFGFWGDLGFKDADLVGLDPDIQVMTYGKDWENK